LSTSDSPGARRHPAYTAPSRAPINRGERPHAVS
jgi:hypothetical protein